MKTVLSLFLIVSIDFPCLIAQKLSYLSGSTKKIEQLVGDYDRHTQSSTANLTNSRYQIWGTDLGVSFSHDRRLYFLFGDIPGDIGYGIDRDPIAYSEDNNPEDGLDLTFLAETNGQYRPITIPGSSHGTFEVPVEGISMDDAMYIYFITGSSPSLTLAKSLDNGKNFVLVEDNITSDKFLNVSANKVKRNQYPELPGRSEYGYLFLGSGDYRQSPVYLLYQPADSIENKESIYFFAGLMNNKPSWSKNENDAAAVLNVDCVGELSSTYIPEIDRWILMYNCDEPRGVNLREARYPWGPYSSEEIIFEPWEDQGYCHFIHTNWDYRNCDEVHDPGREYTWGGEYGPYMIKEFTRVEKDMLTLYYTLSTWNPYTVVLMKSDLAISNTVGISSNENHDKPIKVYPNPSSNLLKIKLPDRTQIHTTAIFDKTGRRLLLQRGSEAINITHLPEGLYFGKAITDKLDLLSFRFVKVNR